MIIDLFLSQPILGMAWLSALILALTVHEFAHAMVGKWRGDETAEQLGRLTLNPLAHLDILGFLMLISVGFGWAKPVPFDPRNLKNPLYDGLLIALAGPGANLMFAVTAGLIFRGLFFIQAASLGTTLGIFLVLLVLLNLFLMIFNLIPIYPLDGAKVVEVLLIGTRYESINRWLVLNGGKILIMAVIISLMTPFDPFSFIEGPAFSVCNILLGHSCMSFLSGYFSG